ncbi:MAG: hypothetical protein CVV07_02665 [Gammaproteobacteria bacterium HGW-Gammaproteobacteria-11]|nr:MAG: hypothetical protein CVV07_02665 [Gammaproteobacteria bacterium HGW-Gammaproteobacteria-11]
MNHIYRTIWNEKTGTCVAVSELAKSSGKKASSVCGEVEGSGLALKTLAASLLLVFSLPLYALPTDGVVTAGSATISTGPGSMTINQSSQNVALNWQSFNIGQGEAVQFVQPNSSSVALNRVLGADPSSILGNLSANGQVFLINPNGIVFGQGASVNVNGLVASTLDINDADFMAGEYTLVGDSAAAVLNQGQINADGGYVVLLGKDVSNQGVISARLGTVALAAGEAITLDVMGDGLLTVSIDQGAVNALVANGGLIQADGGQVLMSAQSAGNLLNTVVNNTGVVQAQTIENRDGVIRLLGDMQSGTVNVAGTLDASAPTGGDGGFIDTSAATVTVADDTQVTTAAAQGLTGSWLIDPTDYTIAASGGDITGAVLSANLANTDITIQSLSGGAGTAGDVNVNDTVTWSANKLTLNAQNDININTEMHGSGTASLALEFGQGAVAAGNTSSVNVNAPVNLAAGENFSTRQGSDGATVNYTVITSLGEAGSVTATDLQGMNGNLAGNYVLGANIDAAASSGWNSGTGFTPIHGSEQVEFYEGFFFTVPLPFTGVFDGLGHNISGLTVGQSSLGAAGLFGFTGTTAEIRNVGLVGGSISGTGTTGALVANNRGTIRNSYSSASIFGDLVESTNVGGLVGANYGSIIDSYATGAVNGARAVGGLTGTNGRQGDDSETGFIIRSHASGAVTAGTYHSGGLVGSNGDAASIVDSYASGSVSGGKNGSGGLVGQNYGSISRSYASGSVTNVQGFVGGLVGVNGGPGTITLSYSTGAVSAANNFGGMVGRSFGAVGSINDSYWNTTTSGLGTSAGGTGLTSVQMQTASNFAAFNFTTTPGATGNNWVMVNVDGSLNNAGGALGATRPMLASEYSTSIRNPHQLQLMSMDLGASYTLVHDLNAAATGTAADVWSNSFIPVGYNGTPFTGQINGQGNSISNLTINRPLADGVGLIGSSFTALIRQLGLVNANVTGRDLVGGLVGHATLGSVINSFTSSGQVNGANTVGGLIGFANTTIITDSYSSNTVSGNNQVGGLFGWTNGGISTNRNYASGAVTGTGSFVGGLAGENGFAFTINNSYATGTVSGVDGVGGLVGYNSNNGNVTNSYSSGAVSGSTNVGGLIGSNIGTVSASFWNTDTSGQAISAGGVGMSTADMQSQANFSSATDANGNLNPNWDLAGTWILQEGITSPLLRSFMTLLTVTVNSDSKTYDGQAYAGENSVSYSFTPDGALLQGSLVYGGSAQGAVNAGNYAMSASGLYSTDQHGYLVNFVDGALTVDPASLTVTSSNVSKVYDGGLTAAGALILTEGSLFGDDALAGGSFAFTDANVGSGNKTVTVSGVTVTDGNSGGNYLVSYVDNSTSTISPYLVSLTGSRTYDGTVDVDAEDLTTGTLVGDETLSLAGSGSVADKHVADGKTLALGSLALADGSHGGLASNYSFAEGGHTVDITPAALTLSTTDVVKLFDDTTDAAGTAIVVAGTLFDTDAISGGSFAFTDPSVGVGNKTVTVSDVTLTDGNLGGNYSVSYANNTTSSITALDPVLSDATLVLLQNIRATATASGSTAPDLSPAAIQALSGLPLTGVDASSLAGLGRILVSNGIRLPPGLQPEGLEEDDDDNQAN